MGGAREKYISTKPDRQKTRFLKQPQNSIGFFLPCHTCHCAL